MELFLRFIHDNTYQTWLGFVEDVTKNFDAFFGSQCRVGVNAETEEKEREKSISPFFVLARDHHAATYQLANVV